MNKLLTPIEKRQEINHQIRMAYSQYENCYGEETVRIQKFTKQKDFHSRNKNKVLWYLDKFSYMEIPDFISVVKYFYFTGDLETFKKYQNKNFFQYLANTYNSLEYEQKKKWERPLREVGLAFSLNIILDKNNINENNMWRKSFNLSKIYLGLSKKSCITLLDYLFSQKEFSVDRVELQEYLYYEMMDAYISAGWFDKAKACEVICFQKYGSEKHGNMWNHYLNSLYGNVGEICMALAYYNNYSIANKNNNFDFFLYFKSPKWSWDKAESQEEKHLVFSNMFLYQRAVQFLLLIPEIKNQVIKDLKNDFSLCPPKSKDVIPFLKMCNIDITKFNNSEDENFSHYEFRKIFEKGGVSTGFLLNNYILKNEPELLYQQNNQGITSLDLIKENTNEEEFIKIQQALNEAVSSKMKGKAEKSLKFNRKTL